MSTTESEKTVLFRKENKVGVITLNRPNRYNAINDDLLADFSDALEQAKLD